MNKVGSIILLTIGGISFLSLIAFMVVIINPNIIGGIDKVLAINDTMLKLGLFGVLSSIGGILLYPYKNNSKK